MDMKLREFRKQAGEENVDGAGSVVVIRVSCAWPQSRI